MYQFDEYLNANNDKIVNYEKKKKAISRKVDGF